MHRDPRALDDAGLTVKDLDGFAIYSFACDPAEVAAILGVPEVRFAASLTSGGGGCAGRSGSRRRRSTVAWPNVCVSVMTLQQLNRRLGGSEVDGVLAYATMSEGGGTYGGGGGISAERGVRRQRRAALAGSQLLGAHAAAHAPLRHDARALRRGRDLAARERDPPADLAADEAALARRVLRRPDDLRAALPVRLHAGDRRRGRGDHGVGRSGQGPQAAARVHPVVGARRHRSVGPAIFRYFQAPDEEFASSGHRPVAKRLYEMAGVTPADVDVALLYDHFSPLVIMQLEDYGFCPIGEGGPFVAEGNIRWPTAPSR